MREYTKSHLYAALGRAMEIIDELDPPSEEKKARIMGAAERVHQRLRMIHPASLDIMAAKTDEFFKDIDTDEKIPEVTITDEEIPHILKQYRSKGPWDSEALEKRLYKLRPDLKP